MLWTLLFQCTVSTQFTSNDGTSLLTFHIFPGTRQFRTVLARQQSLWPAAIMTVLLLPIVPLEQEHASLSLNCLPRL